MPCERMVNLSAGGRDLSCRGLIFEPPDGAYLLLGLSLKILEVSQKPLPPLTDRETPFEETLYLLQFSYTVDRAGDYMAPASTNLVHLMVWEEDHLLTLICRNLL